MLIARVWRSQTSLTSSVRERSARDHSVPHLVSDQRTADRAPTKSPMRQGLPLGVAHSASAAAPVRDVLRRCAAATVRVDLIERDQPPDLLGYGYTATVQESHD